MENNAIEIKKWMLERRLRQVDVAKKANVSNTAIFLFIHGKTVSAKIKQTFLSLGCPNELLERAA
ncbi:MAG: hypothetical protein WDA26_12175 [Pusillimonas sp.]